MKQRIFKYTFIVFLVISISLYASLPVLAYTFTDDRTFEDKFDVANLDGYDVTTEHDSTVSLETSMSTDPDDPTYLEITGADTGSNRASGIAEVNGGGITVLDNDTVTIEYWHNINFNARGYSEIRLVGNSSGDTMVRFGLGDPEGDGGANNNMYIYGGYVTNNETDTPDSEGEWNRLSLTLDFNDNTVEGSLRGPNGQVHPITTTVQDHPNGQEEFVISYHSRKQSTSTNTFWTGRFENVTITSTEGPASNLSLDINEWMRHGSTQKYEVDLNEGGSISDVTRDANVSSSDVTVVTVDNSTDELIATSDVSVNEEVEITARFDGESVTENVTVANRTLANIGIMPPSSWLAAFLGIDGDSTEGGIGATDIQWIYIIIITMSAITFITDNSWIGIGTGVSLVFLFWVLDFVGGDVLIGSLFFAIFISISLLDVDRGTEVNVTTEREF